MNWDILPIRTHTELLRYGNLFMVIVGFAGVWFQDLRLLVPVQGLMSPYFFFFFNMLVNDAPQPLSWSGQHFIYLVVGFLNVLLLMAFGSFLAFAMDPGQRGVLLGFLAMCVTLAPGFLLWKQLLLIQGIRAKSTAPLHLRWA